MGMWLICMDPKLKNTPEYKENWDAMEEYNINDVFLTEDLYERVLGWIPNHPNHSLYDEDVVCPRCGGKNFQKRGWAYTNAFKYRRFQCKDDGGWARSSKREPLDLPEKLIQVA